MAFRTFQRLVKFALKHGRIERSARFCNKRLFLDPFLPLETLFESQKYLKNCDSSFIFAENSLLLIILIGIQLENKYSINFHMDYFLNFPTLNFLFTLSRTILKATLHFFSEVVRTNELVFFFVPFHVLRCFPRTLEG